MRVRTTYQMTYRYSLISSIARDSRAGTSSIDPEPQNLKLLSSKISPEKENEAEAVKTMKEGNRRVHQERKQLSHPRPSHPAAMPRLMCHHRVILSLFILIALFQQTSSLSSSPPRKKQSITRTPKQQGSSSPVQSRQVDDSSSQARRQQSLHVGHNPLLSLNLNLDALARAQAADRAQELYQRIAALHREGYYATSPDIVSFNSVLKALQSDPARALEFWEKEVEHLSAANKPNIRSYNTFLLSLAKCGLYQDAEKLLEHMLLPNSAVVPDRISYNTLLLAYTMSPETSAAARADMVLRDMLSDETHVQPDIISFNTVLSAWNTHPNPKTAARKTEEWLRHLKEQETEIRPDVYTYTTVLQAWARCASDGSGRKTTKKSRTIAGDNSFSKSLDPATVASQRTYELLEEMKRSGLQPNRVTYTVVMQALCETGQPQAAHAVLRDMLEMARQQPAVRPDCIAFSALLDGYAQQAAEKPQQTLKVVQALLGQMKDLAVEWPDTAPSQRTYTSLLSALAQSRQREAGSLAEAYLQEMWNTGVTPSVIHYNAALDVWAKSPRADKAVYAFQLFDQMQRMGIAPDGITYNTLLAVTSNVFGTEELKKSALQQGLHVFAALQDDPDFEPTTLSYHYWFKTLRKLMPPTPSRKEVVRQAFQLCCQQGCLNDMVLQYILKFLVTEEQQEVQNVLGDEVARLRSQQTGEISVSNLPASWSRNSLGPNKSRHDR